MQLMKHELIPLLCLKLFDNKVCTDVFLGEGVKRDGLRYMTCVAEIQNTTEEETSNFNQRMHNISDIYANDVLPLPVSLEKICM